MPAGTWLSGAAGDDVPTGAFGAWRGTPVQIAGTWANTDEGQVALWQLRPGGVYASWTQSIDIAIGAIDKGETWAQAAKGAYDGRWRQSLTNLHDLWGSRSGTAYIRLAHEMNGNWFPWAVNAGNYQDFITAWKRFRALQQQIFPASKLVFSVNRSSNGNNMDWRKSFPGSQYVDVIGVDYYNNWPYAGSQADFNSALNSVDQYGAPIGLQAHLDYARSVGLPLAIPEWSGHADAGDSPAFIKGMHDFFAAHAGGGAGQVIYDVLFNVTQEQNATFSLFGKTRMPASAEEYRKDF